MNEDDDEYEDDTDDDDDDEHKEHLDCDQREESIGDNEERSGFCRIRRIAKPFGNLRSLGS